MSKKQIASSKDVLRQAKNTYYEAEKLYAEAMRATKQAEKPFEVPEIAMWLDRDPEELSDEERPEYDRVVNMYTEATQLFADQEHKAFVNLTNAGNAVILAGFAVAKCYHPNDTSADEIVTLIHANDLPLYMYNKIIPIALKLPC